MRLALFVTLSATLALARTIPTPTIPRRDPTPTTEELFTIELAPGETKQVTEAEKWELKKVRSYPSNQSWTSFLT